jgi:uncharacterized membrane protein
MTEPARQAPSRHRCLFDVAVTGTLLVAALVFAGYGIFRYGFWQNNGPGAGFFPTVFGLAAAIAAAAILVRRTQLVEAGIEWRSFAPAAAVVAAVLATPLIGMIPALVVFIFLWVKLVENHAWRPTLITTVVAGLVLHFVFAVWLGVRFPDSMLTTLLESGG